MSLRGLLLVVFLALLSVAVAYGHNKSALERLKEGVGKSDDMVINVSSEAIRLDPRLLEAYKMRAFALMRKKRFDEAISDAEQVLKENAGIAWPYFVRGKANYYMGQGSNEDMLRDFRTAVSLDPRLDDGYLCLAIAYVSSKQYQKACEAFSRALVLKPFDKQIFRYRAGSYSTMGRHDLAIKDLDTYIRLAPKCADGYMSRGAEFGIVCKYERALADFARAIELAPGEYSYRAARASLLSRLARHGEAAIDYSEAIKVNPLDEDLFLKRGKEYFNLRLYDKALADFNAAIDLSPEYESAYWARCRLYETVGDHRLSLKDRDKAMQLSKRPAVQKI